MTHSLAAFTRPGAAVWFPGAPFMLAGALTATSMLMILLGGRRIFERLESHHATRSPS